MKSRRTSTGTPPYASARDDTWWQEVQGRSLEGRGQITVLTISGILLNSNGSDTIDGFPNCGIEFEV